MKKLKVLIIENGSGLSGAAAKLMAEIFSDFDCPFGAEFFYLKTYHEAMTQPQETLILNGYYEVAVLIGETGSFELFDAEDNIFCGPKRPLPIFISESEYLIERAIRETEFLASFLVRNGATDMTKATLIRETLIQSGKISRQVSVRKILDPVCVFSQLLSEESQKRLNLVASVLNTEEIPWALVTKTGNQEVITEKNHLPLVKQLILSSSLRFWKTWLRAEVKTSVISEENKQSAGGNIEELSQS